MYWKDITDKHNNRKVSVSAKSTPNSPYRGEGPFVGYVECPKPDSIPILNNGIELHSFAWYWEVKLLND